MFNYIPNLLICDNYNIFMDIPNVDFDCLNDFDKYINDCRVIVDNLNTINIDDIRDKLFNCSYYDNNYTILKSNTDKYLLTIYIITLNTSQFTYALESALGQNIDCKINIIKNQSSNNFMNDMFENRCKTNYFIQMDEDMIFVDKDCALKMYDKIINENDNIWQYCFSLKDYNFGVGINFQLLGIKIFNYNILKNIKLNILGIQDSFAIDRIINSTMVNHGFKTNWTEEHIGFHQLNHKPFDLFLRCSKIGHELFNKSISNWGYYEYGTFMRYLTFYDYRIVSNTIIYIINKLNNDPQIFINKINNIKTPSYFIYDIEKQNLILKNNPTYIVPNKYYYINEQNILNLERLKNMRYLDFENFNVPNKDIFYYQDVWVHLFNIL